MPSRIRAVGPWGQLDAWVHPELNRRQHQYTVTSDIWIHATGQSYYMQIGAYSGHVTYPGPQCTCREHAQGADCIHVQVAEVLRRPRLTPSQTTDRYWLQAWAPLYDVTPRVGKWIIKLPAAGLDEAWNKLLVSLWENKLGPSMKARTAVPDPRFSNAEKVVCVYTKDSNDQADKKRVRDELHHLGFTRLTYKTDEETRRGIG